MGGAPLMFFDEDRIRAVREMILAEDEKARRVALGKLLPMQRADFVELFKIMGGLPVTIRLLDPPLHRAALQAGEIAETAEFFSFGTNDLTQTTFGISRDDAASFLDIYTAKGILAVHPFVSIDREGVGELVRMPPSAAARCGQNSSSASAASTAAIPPRFRSATSSGWTTCRARRSACRSRDWPPPKPRWAVAPVPKRKRFVLPPVPTQAGTKQFEP
jgi:hypothetical protein